MSLFPEAEAALSKADGSKPFRTQLLKWVGNKQRFADEIVSYFPKDFGTYYEPFLGSGAVLGTLAPKRGVGSDSFSPLMEIWKALAEDPDILKDWYSFRRDKLTSRNKVALYEEIKESYNRSPNGADFIYLSRACYGGVVRFRQADGYMSTPCGVHTPIPSASFAKRVDLWARRLRGVAFERAEFQDILKRPKRGDLVYCDPPYTHSQSILYGAQRFSLEALLEAIAELKSKGVAVALSIDGTKKSGDRICDLPVPKKLFRREAFVNCGRSMLRRFQMKDQTLEKEVVADRLLLTY
jgi:DNA adenine methylase